MFYWIARNLIWFLFKIAYWFQVVGVENIPSNTNFIVCANHISNLDPLLVGVSIPKKVCFMAKEELFKFKLLGFVLRKIGAFPISRGNHDVGAVKTAFNILNNNGNVAMFPEGRRGKRGKMLRGKTGAVMIAIKTEVPIVPVGIVGRYTPFGRIKVIIGKPLNFSEYYGKKVTQEEYQGITDNVLMKQIACLAGVE